MLHIIKWVPFEIKVDAWICSSAYDFYSTFVKTIVMNLNKNIQKYTNTQDNETCFGCSFRCVFYNIFYFCVHNFYSSVYVS